MPSPQPPVTITDFKTYYTREFVYGDGPDRVMDIDITKALNQATFMFNKDLWDATEISIAFLTASAHFLVLNLQSAGGLSAVNRNQGQNSHGQGVIASKSVGQISVNYTVPDFAINVPALAQFMKTDFGQLYLQMLQPRLIGGVQTMSGPVDPLVGSPSLPFTF